ncbi:hypothetical protein TPHA_0C04980 [Tetrapisispora phaffii CBS 4417]|uniref:Zn(2)-C6 fungal-type domain-containing protein n=1 Tax=Tetrapisispora phaffii (strain ATCC 24235 / CBS 4417 / NBRC 1672 / NRRL Y-8282 / UCD 70-5) TaxID=1071381 RepID=G8BQY4_TETPH|nr:hypothetical protein TPHA_0C04980 [Tetrapisispora phaffii CBS 4417]CCE62646.1 hypothetical protein TPHA_0C04980 [Tetrapisispora phaffii CBS 4417]
MVKRISTSSRDADNKRAKTFEGCWTCRLRKIKCDLKKPKCDKCRSSAISCSGYDIKLVWKKPSKFQQKEAIDNGSVIRKLESDKFDNDIYSDDDHGTDFVAIKSQKRRNIPLVRYNDDEKYRYYEEIDEDMAYLQDLQGTSLNNNKPTINNHFGVLKVNSSSSSIGDSNIETYQIPESVPKTLLSINDDNTMSNILDNSNEWISNELRTDFLLSASAIQGLPLSSTSINQNRSEVEFQNLYKLIFHKDDDKRELDNSTFLTNSKILTNEKETDNFLKNLFDIDNDSLDASDFIDGNNQRDSYSYEKLLDDKDLINNMATIVPLQDNFSFENLPNSTKMSHLIMEIEKSELPDVISISDPLLNFPKTALKVNSLTRFLLNYYEQNVADLMTVIPVRANPWKKLYFPIALKTLGDLTGLGRTSNSRSSLFNAILAVSCFYLQGKFPKNSREMLFFLNQGINFRKQAVFYLKECLNNNVKYEKYKDILTSLLSMNSIDVVWGTMSDCQYYLSICEDFIEARLISRPKISEKAKLLHSIFAFLKVFQDSTALDKVKQKEIISDKDFYFDKELIINKDKFFDLHSHYYVEYSEGKFYCLSKEGLRSTKPVHTAPLFKNLVTESYSVMTETLNLNEINTGTLYGLPNSLILLFSDCVSLLRHLEYYRLNSIDISPAFLSSCIVYESRLLNWSSEWDFENIEILNDINNKTKYDQNISSNQPKILNDSLISLQCHMNSFYNGLIIYYYTMVRGFDKQYLKNYVVDVLKDLQTISDLVDKSNVKMVPLIWQGFIAGCNCIDQGLQEDFRQWAANLANTGVGSYWAARQVMLEVWRRQKTNEEHGKWYDVYKEWSMNLMLV